MRELATVNEIIKELGGPTAVGKLVGRSPQSAVNWRRAGRFPADTFLIFQDRLRDAGIQAPPALWGIKEPVQ